MRILPYALALTSFALIGAVHADDMPTRKPGLWEMVMQQENAKALPSHTVRQCIDEATDAETRDFGMNAAKGACSEQDLQVSGDVMTINAVCKFGTSTQTTRATTTFSGDTAYHTDIVAQFDPPMMGKSEMHSTMDAKWVGPCPSDMRPGDMMLDNGFKMNMKDAMGGKGFMPHQ